MQVPKKTQAYFGLSLGFHVICILLQSFSQKVNYNQLSMGPIYNFCYKYQVLICYFAIILSTKNQLAFLFLFIFI